jgi:drug/metabolite transporter (DMT)-like permease
MDGKGHESPDRKSRATFLTMNRQSVETPLVVISWFVLNIAMGSSTKWLFIHGQICPDEGVCVPYRFPLAITVVHMGFSWTMCRAHLYIRGAKLGGLGFREQVDKIAPLAGCFALSVAMGNMSLKYIYPSFNQMLGATSPLITVFMAVVMQQKRYNASTWISMPVICGGLLVCSGKEVNFHALGAALALGAAVLRAVKSLIQGKLLTEKLDSVSLLYYMAPWSALLLSVLSLIAEGLEPISLLMLGFVGANGVGNVCFLLIVSGLNACLLNVSNFLVTSYTSAVTLQVLGNVKSCLSIAISVAIFRNELLWEQAIGVVTCLAGVWYYNKYGGPAKPAAAPKRAEHSTELVEPAPSAASTEGSGDDHKQSSHV